MDQNQKMRVAAAIEGITSGGDDSYECASFIIEAFKGLKVSAFQISFESNKESDSREGMTEYGNMSFDTSKDEEAVEYGTHKERVGKWVIRKIICPKKLFSKKKHQVLLIHHFLYQGSPEETHRLFFLEYGENLKPIAFGYHGDYKVSFSFGPFSVYHRSLVVMLGETTLPKSEPLFTINL